MSGFKFNIGQMVEVYILREHKHNGRVGRVIMREGDELDRPRNVYLMKDATGETFGAIESNLRRYVEPFANE
jgi:hypothetical protein